MNDINAGTDALLFFCPRWGTEDISWDEFFANVKAAGYDGVEASLPFGSALQEPILNGLAKHGLLLIAQHWETVTQDFDLHCKEYTDRLVNLSLANPLFINSQTGKDHYSFDQNKKLLSIASDIASASATKIVHETHRGKFSFAAHVAEHYLEQIPELRITLDISHWYNVAETFLQDQQAAVALATLRTDHIHARVGFTQGSQVNDPRAPEWNEALGFHLEQWDKVVARKINLGEVVTITPEFGAPPYLPLQPYTLKPLASQWEVNVFMMELLRSRYNTSSSERS
jgi:sugar phosphate isomerase/epimerase